MWTELKSDYRQRMLWACVMRRAVFDYVLYKGVGKHRLQWQEAHQYLFCGATPNGHISFDDTCAMFSWEPDYIRKLVTKMSRADLKKIDITKFRDEFDLDLDVEEVEDETPELEVALSVAVLPMNAGRWHHSPAAVPTIGALARVRRHRHVAIPQSPWGVSVCA